MRISKYVEDKNDIIRNCLYIIENIDNQYIKERIYNGRHFIKYVYNGTTYFFPNKFISYKNNTIEKYKNRNVGTLAYRDKVEMALNKTYKEDDSIELEYRQFCKDFQLPTTQNESVPKHKRKYILLED